MKKILTALGLIVALSAPATAAIGSEEAAIQHLIGYMRSTNTVYFRDGETHTAGENADYVAMKYRYVRNNVRTAEQFIEYVASGSSLTGMPYKYREVDGREANVENLLRAELARYRNQ